jgi:hypothetical protein
VKIEDPARVGKQLEQALRSGGPAVIEAIVDPLEMPMTRRSIHSPQHRSLVLAGHGDCPTAADQVPWVAEHGSIALEAFDRRLLVNELKKGFKRHSELLPDGNGWLLVESGGTPSRRPRRRALLRRRRLPQPGGVMCPSY